MTNQNSTQSLEYRPVAHVWEVSSAFLEIPAELKYMTYLGKNKRGNVRQYESVLMEEMTTL